MMLIFICQYLSTFININNIKSNALSSMNFIYLFISSTLLISSIYLSGLLDSLEFRLPLTNPSAETMQKLEKILIKYEVIK